ncbi:CD209 antigen-like protein C [Archocentrus centrarchus]|uniref:CD209 antigen-like protein C n=1 Tax=Archocentrus centrarchus TaxID=63155 RepID=UPI0011E9FFEC|nr:CD209 antigen-like protein C [Archocentrus centrarchus]
MSSDIYTKVRYNRKEQEDGAEWAQREVDIYESTDVIRDSYAHFQSQEGGPQTQNPPSVQKGSFRCAKLGLRVLCLLMLAGIIILSICYILVSLEKEQLSISYSRLQADHSVNLCQLQSRYDSLSKNYSQLQTRLSADKIQLQEEVKQLKDTMEKMCPEGWSRFGCSCYFKSTERKTWSESWTDCWNKRADLVIIKSKEEQQFISKLNLRGESWIGLEAKNKQMSRLYKWEWVDRSALEESKMFWAPGFGNPSTGYCGVCCDDHGRWTHSPQYSYGHV